MKYIIAIEKYKESEKPKEVEEEVDKFGLTKTDYEIEKVFFLLLLITALMAGSIFLLAYIEYGY